MPKLIKSDGTLVDDGVTVLRDATGVLPGGPVLVPLARWLAEHDALRARGDVGVWLAPADDPAALAADVASLALIGVDFPTFADGRGYSTARLLRDRYGYRGQLRAIGGVQRDQLAYLLQVGFDAFALSEGSDVEGAVAGLRDFTDGYQLTHLRAPWFRRRAAQEAGA